MPVYNPPLEFLEKAIQSVVGQVYENWEICIADDASTNPGVKPFLQNWAEREPRIKVLFREENGHISLASNSACGMASGEYLLFLDQDDEVTPDALGEVVAYLAENPDTEILYTDDDKIDESSQRYAPQFKPQWSPELLLSYMYLAHLLVIRRSLFEQVGGFRTGFEGSQDYDLALRAAEVAVNVGHIPKVLYHWRALPSSTASSGNAKPDSFRAGRMAVQEALTRRGIVAEVYQPDWAIKAGCGIFSHMFPDDGQRVAIIIPTRNNVGMLKSCLESIKRTTYRNYEITIIDNESDDPETLNFLRRVPHHVLRLPNPTGGFNFAAINNRAVEQTEADYILFLNNDTEVISPEWLTQMVGYLGITGVGGVGARLVFPDGRIQHAGVVHGYYDGLVGPAFKLLPATDPGYLGYTKVVRNYSAVTAACMITPKDLFLRMGGFDEENFAVAYNDVDYCYRLLGAGHRIVYCPSAELMHHEGHSRERVDNPAEPASLRRKYREFEDAYYNPNLSLKHERFSIEAKTIAPKQLQPLRILMCTHNLNWEGAPLCQFEIAVGLKNKGIIEPVIYSPEEGPLRRAFEEEGIQVEVAPHPLARTLFVPGEYERAIEDFAGWIQELNVEVVYANTALTFYAIHAAKVLGIPSIWNLHESEPWQSYFDHFGPYVSARALECFNHPYQVLFDSNATRAKWSDLNARHNFFTIQNGLDLKEFAREMGRQRRASARKQLKVGDNELMILIMATICDRKGQMDLVEAVGRLADEQVEKIRCFIVGDRASAYSEQLHQARRDLGLKRSARIHILPETSDRFLYYAGADIYVGSSRLESFPRVILEAMAAELSIITTPVCGVVEQVNETNALFYQPGDTKTLAANITLLLQNPALRQAMVDNHKYMLETLISYEEMIEAYGEAFREAWLSGEGANALRVQDVLPQ